jgi:hypothetical protein
MTLYRSIKYNFRKYRDLAFWLIADLFFAVLGFCCYVASKTLLTTIPQWSTLTITYLLLTCGIICSAKYLFRLWSNLRLPRHYYYYWHVKTRITVTLIVSLIYIHTTVCWVFEAIGYSLYTF